MPGTHAATFGGNPLSCAAGVATMNVLLNDDIPEKSKRLGAEFKQRLEALQQKFDSILEVRGMGLMIGVQMNEPVAPYVKKLRQHGYIVGPAGPNVLRFLPPLIISETDLFPVVDVLEQLLNEDQNS